MMSRLRRELELVWGSLPQTGVTGVMGVMGVTGVTGVTELEVTPGNASGYNGYAGYATKTSISSEGQHCRNREAPPPWDEADWAARFDEIAGRLEYEEGVDRAEAESFAAAEIRELMGD